MLIRSNYTDSLNVYVNSMCEEIHRINPDVSPQEGLVYAVEFSHRSGRDLLNVAKKRTNIIPIIEDARHPHKYRMLVGKSKRPGTQTQAVFFCACCV